VTKVDDNFLVQQTLNGNKNAFRFLVLRYQKPIFKILGALIYDKQMVEEIAQETFLRAFKSLLSFDSNLGASFSTWLFTIARNLAFNELDKRKVRKANDEKVLSNEELSTDGPDKDLESAQTNTVVRQAVGQLPKEFRMAVVLSCLEGHSISEIAQIEGCSEGTVKSRIFRGKQMLRGFLIPVLGDGYGKNL
jgi:RNA polymerase sigma-70 factor (ECF subfamily)